MVYSNHFVLCILVDGEAQQELANGVVKLPFGAEYALRLRNKNNRRAVAKIYVDGENVSGDGYVVSANDHVDIKRHWDKDRSFKFVSLDSGEAVDAGKNGPNPDKSKGLVEVHFYLEKEVRHTAPVYRTYEQHHHHHHYSPAPTPWPVVRPIWYGTGSPPDQTVPPENYSSGEIKMICCDTPSEIKCSMSFGSSQTSPELSNPQNAKSADPDAATFKRVSLRSRKSITSGASCSLDGLNEAAPSSYTTPELKDGCTVEGESTGQRFTTAWIDTEDTYTTLKVFLQGFEEEKVVQQAKEPKKHKKSDEIADLEAENDRLRKELAEIENEKLKKKLKRAKKKKEDPTESKDS